MAVHFRGVVMCQFYGLLHFLGVSWCYRSAAVFQEKSRVAKVLNFPSTLEEPRVLDKYSGVLV